MYSKFVLLDLVQPYTEMGQKCPGIDPHFELCNTYSISYCRALRLRVITCEASSGCCCKYANKKSISLVSKLCSLLLFIQCDCRSRVIYHSIIAIVYDPPLLNQSRAVDRHWENQSVKYMNFKLFQIFNYLHLIKYIYWNISLNAWI